MKRTVHPGQLEVTVSLQGSLETFALPDVLVLLASTKKSGELRVVGGETDGRVWVREGQLVQTAIGGKDTPSVETVFELLRISSGTFSFAADQAAPKAHEPEVIDGVLSEAQARLAEWREIEKVIPSLESVLDMAAEAPSAQVTVSAEQWKLLVALAGGRSVQQLMSLLDRNAFDVCKALKGMVESRLVTVEAPKAKAEPKPEAAPAPEARQAPAPEARPQPPRVAASTPTSPPERGGVRPRVRATTQGGSNRPLTADPRQGRPAAAAAADATPPDAPPDNEAKPAAAAADGKSEPAATPAGKPGSPSPEAQALVAQLAALGDDEEEAAEKVAAALAEGAELPKAAEGDEPINRGLLLKFLSSVRN
jgi:hypothetical protein